MAADSERRNSDAELLHELEALSQSLSLPHPTRRTASLILPRSSAPTSNAIPDIDNTTHPDRQPRSGRLSISPWRSRPNQHLDKDKDHSKHHLPSALTRPNIAREKKGIWSWKPMRALSHIGMRRIGCLFSVEVITVQGLPASMNDLRLSVDVRKKESKDGAVRTMPSRVLQGSAEFEERLFIRCHLYCTEKPLVFEPRPFLISVVAVDAPDLKLGTSIVDLSALVKESVERSLDGAWVRQWATTLELSGKAKGGELVLKLGFQITEDGGVLIYSQAKELTRMNNKGRDSSPSFARKQSKSSFSVINYPSVQKSEPQLKAEDLDLPEFEVVEMGIEIEAERREENKAEAEETVDKISVSREIVKETVHHHMVELDSIAKQIKALESTITKGNIESIETAKENVMHKLHADEETVMREFLQMLESGDDKEPPNYNKPNLETQLKLGAVEEGSDGEAKVFLSDLGKGLGPVVQTRDGGYLASMNPFNIEVVRKEIPKLAMQISKPFVLRDQKLESGLVLFQRLAAMGTEELASKLHSLMAMDELMGKTAEQVAFEGIASAIIGGRNKEGASSSAVRTIIAIKTMAAAIAEGRKERTSMGIWNAKEEAVTVEEILAFSMQKIEAMAVEALQIQADMADEEAPFDVSPLIGYEEDLNCPLDSAILLEEWARTCGSDDSITLLVTIQLRDPLQRYEPVGGPAIVVVKAATVEDGGQDKEKSFKVMELHIGGLKLKSGGKRSSCWDGERQRFSAMQWLVGYGVGKAGKNKKKKNMEAKADQDIVWSLSSQVMADMWLETTRNPDVKVPNK